MAEEDLATLARKLASKCAVEIPTGGITVQFISHLYDRICQPYLEDPPILPDLKTQPKEHLLAILESLSCNFLNLDLDELTRVEDILAQNEKSLHLLLRIFDNLHDCLVAPHSAPDQEIPAPVRPSSAPVRSKSSPSRKRFIGPTYMGKRIADMRSVSVVYSPRTVALRQMRRYRSAHDRPIQPSRPDTKTAINAREDAVRRNFETEEAGGTKSDQAIDSPVHKNVLSLHRHHLAVDKRRARIAVEAAKASIRNLSAKKRHISAMTKRAIGQVLLKNVSSHIKLEHAKDKARRALLQQLKDGTVLKPGDATRLRLLRELGNCPQPKINEPSAIDKAKERAIQTKEIRSLLSDLTAKVLC